MIRALWTASTGMEAQQTKLDVISNNLANVNTAGFKRSRAEFQDLLYQQMKTPGSNSTAGTKNPAGIQIGHGTRTSAVQKIHDAGSVSQTSRAYDLAIEGSGFFQIQTPDGDMAYTRDGGFELDAEGNVVNSSGFALEPQITVPVDAETFTVGSDGTVSVTYAGQTDAEEIGQISLVRFMNPSGLKAIGSNLYNATDVSGEPIEATPGEDGTGTIAQGALEMSNVNLVEEMVNMITTERGYEFSSKILKASDEMLQTAARVTS